MFLKIFFVFPVAKFFAFFKKTQKNEKLLQKLLIFFVQCDMIIYNCAQINTVDLSVDLHRYISEQSSAQLRMNVRSLRRA